MAGSEGSSFAGGDGGVFMESSKAGCVGVFSAFASSKPCEVALPLVSGIGGSGCERTG
jgi:hypothetical protein